MEKKLFELFDIEKEKNIIPVFIIVYQHFSNNLKADFFYYEKNEKRKYILKKDTNAFEGNQLYMISKILKEIFVPVGESYENYIIKDLTKLNVRIDFTMRISSFSVYPDNFDKKFTFYFNNISHEDRKFLKEINPNNDIKLFIELNT